MVRQTRFSFLNSSDPRSRHKHSFRPGSARATRATRLPFRSRRPEGKLKRGWLLPTQRSVERAWRICVSMISNAPVCASPQASVIRLEWRVKLASQDFDSMVAAPVQYLLPSYSGGLMGSSVAGRKNRVSGLR